jgi:hypothetical protein
MGISDLLECSTPRELITLCVLTTSTVKNGLISPALANPTSTLFPSILAKRGGWVQEVASFQYR